MAWLKVSFPSALGATEDLTPGGLAWREAARFAERECPLFFTEDFRDVGCFIGSLLQTCSQTAQVLTERLQLSITTEVKNGEY
jgi:hypothetical protein